MAKPDKLDVIWGSDPSAVNTDPTDAKTILGWVSEIPPYQWFNYIMNKWSAFIDHINSRGIAEWDAVTIYELGAKVLYGNKEYICTSAGSTGSLPSTLTEWKDPEQDLKDYADAADVVLKGVVDGDISGLQSDIDANAATLSANINQSVKTGSSPSFGRLTLTEGTRYFKGSDSERDLYTAIVQHFPEGVQVMVSGGYRSGSGTVDSIAYGERIGEVIWFRGLDISYCRYAAVTSSCDYALAIGPRLA